MKLIYLSHFYPKSRIDYYLSKSRAGLAAAADAHQYAIALGLNEYSTDLEIINVPALFYFPLRYKKFRHKGEYIEENGLTIHNLSFNLMMEYTFISQYRNTKRKLLDIVRNSKDDIYIIVYGIKQQLMHAAIDVKNQFPDRIKLCDIIPDLPEDVNTHGNIVSSLISVVRNRFNRPASEYFKYFDKYVLLTKYMKEVVGCKEGSYIVSEGIYEEKVSKRIEHQENSTTFTIFYGGMLYEKFGIKNLVDAVFSIDNPSIRLQLCGFGDCTDYIKEISRKDSRIQHLGVLSRAEVLNLQSKASLLVNPRIPDGNPFTRYSFPSKTMEYFGSGTPTLLYQLEGIPGEYYKYCYSLDSKHIDTQSLSDKIIEIIDTPVKERLELASSARQFVIDKKNYKIVGKQIFDFINEK